MRLKVFVRDHPHALIAGLITACMCCALAVIRPLFHDEASTINFAGGRLPYLFSMLRQDVHPPLYFVIIWGWIKTFGDSPFPLRLLSALCMGASVVVFLQALKTWLGKYPSRLATLAIATSPFLVFCGYFARYYALACLLWVCCFWAVGLARKNPCVRYCAFIGLFGALLFLTNYAAALIACAGVLPFAITLMARRQWTNLAALALPGVIAIACWFPMLQDQLTADLPNRWDSDSLVTPMRIIKNAGFLAWTLGVSDGLPPWSITGLCMAPVLLIIAGFGAWFGIARTRQSITKDPANIRYITIISLLMLAAGVLVGVLLLPGPMYSFLPPRVALCGFAWLILLVVIPDYRMAYRKTILGLVILAHLWANVHMMVLNDTTNWAYQVPAKEIAETALRIADNRAGSDGIFLPEKSMVNIRHYLNRHKNSRPNGSVILNPGSKSAESIKDVEQVIIIRHTRSPEWPPRIAVDGSSSADPVKMRLANPEGNWKRTHSIPFLKEDPAAQQLKARFSDNEVFPDKIRLDVWQRRKP